MSRLMSLRALLNPMAGHYTTSESPFLSEWGARLRPCRHVYNAYSYPEGTKSDGDEQQVNRGSKRT